MTTIDKVVRAANAEAGYKNLRHYLLFLHFAFDGLYKLKRDNVMLGFRFISIPVVDRVAIVPASVLAMGQIGWQRGQRIIQGEANANLSLDPAAKVSSCEVLYPGNYYGMRYRINNSVSPVQIVFEHQPKDNLVYVEVIDKVDAPTTETLVNEEGVLPMKSYIHHRFARFKMGAASAESKESEREYLDEMDEAMAGQSDLTPQGIYNALARKMWSSWHGNAYPFYLGHY